MDAEISPGQAPLAVGASGLEEVLQNVRVILTTPRGGVMGDREFGVDQGYLDSPTPKAKALFMSSVVEAVARYEPRARVTAIEWRESAGDGQDGVLRPVVRVSIEEESL